LILTINGITIRCYLLIVSKKIYAGKNAIKQLIDRIVISMDFISNQINNYKLINIIKS